MTRDGVAVVRLQRYGVRAEVVLDRPPVNAFDESLVDELSAAVREVGEDPGIRCLVIRGTGVFSGGADIGLLDSWLRRPDGPVRTAAFVRRMQQVFGDVAELPVPTVAAITRAATGGGLELALACDLRVTSAGARIGLPETRIGLIPGAGGTQRLTALAGPGVASRLILTGELIDGEEAVRQGIAHLAVDEEEVLAVARATADRMAAAPRDALRAAKNCIAAAGSPHGLRTELAAVEELSAGASTQQLLSAFARSRNGGRTAAGSPRQDKG